MKKIRYLAEALIVRFAIWFFYVLGKKNASNFAAKLAKFVGKKLAVNRLAFNNLSNALPELNNEQKEEILDGMWDNLGRIIGEYPHIAKYSLEEIHDIIDMSDETKNNLAALRNSKKGGIIFSGHIGNWEIGPKAFLSNGINVSTVYRPLNNPYVEDMTAKIRGVELIGKSSKGNRKIIETIKKGDFVIILADQKISDGELVKFFHEDALTTTAIARIALKYDIPLIPARSIRIGKKFKFIVEVEKPLAFQKTSNINSDILHLTRQVNFTLERWIREYPSQWFWVHNRWKK
jgi:KDO2-lipid IV(A) lauroyltransferase